VTWLILALVIAALAVIVWVSRQRAGQRSRAGDVAARRRSAEERLRARDERSAVRRLRDDEESKP
jgi:hypothetical protein